MLPLLSWAQVVLVSAKEDIGLDAIYAAADEAHENFEKTIDPEELYPVVTKIKKHFVARAKGPKSATLYDLRQVKVAPPTFIASVDEVQAVHFSYLRFVENRLREEFDLTGSPLQIVVRKGILRRP
jgi:GTP-binding protein